MKDKNNHWALKQRKTTEEGQKKDIGEGDSRRRDLTSAPTCVMIAARGCRSSSCFPHNLTKGIDGEPRKLSRGRDERNNKMYRPGWGERKPQYRQQGERKKAGRAKIFNQEGSGAKVKNFKISEHETRTKEKSKRKGKVKVLGRIEKSNGPDRKNVKCRQHVLRCTKR